MVYQLVFLWLPFIRQCLTKLLRVCVCVCVCYFHACLVYVNASWCLCMCLHVCLDYRCACLPACLHTWLYFNSIPIAITRKSYFSCKHKHKITHQTVIREKCGTSNTWAQLTNGTDYKLVSWVVLSVELGTMSKNKSGITTIQLVLYRNWLSNPGAPRSGGFRNSVNPMKLIV